MSFRDSFLKSRLARLPPDVDGGTGNDDDEEEEEEELDSFDADSLPGSSTSIIGGFLKPRSRAHAQQDYSPQSGSEYWGSALSVDTSAGTFRVYCTPPADASATARHGSISDGEDDSSSVVFVFHHGAGYSGMSCALLAKEMYAASKGRAGILSLDARGHGKTVVSDELHMDIDTLAEDLCAVLKEVYPSKDGAPNLVLVGHSMGGSVVVKACAQIQRDISHVVGVVNLDVVEGTAMEFLSNMMEIINARPKGFASLEDAIAWHVTTRTITNIDSARVSVPTLFNESTEADPNHRYLWRTDLAATQPYWEGWFSTLSSSFLSQRCAKLLVLAGAESLDKDLMVGQMQGKYQLVVYQDVGHCLQEDAPSRLAGTLLEFWRRNDMTDILKNVKKVGQS